MSVPESFSIKQIKNPSAKAVWGITLWDLSSLVGAARFIIIIASSPNDCLRAEGHSVQAGRPSSGDHWSSCGFEVNLVTGTERHKTAVP